MTNAADDVEHIRKARDKIRSEVTTGESQPICPTCAGFTFVVKPSTGGIVTGPCPTCRPLPTRPFL